MCYFKPFQKLFKSRLLCEDSGAVTIDFIVMSASIVLIGAMLINVILGGVYDLSGSIDARLLAASSDTPGTSPSNALSYPEYVELTGDDFLAADSGQSNGPQTSGEYSNDVVWADGYFVQYPDLGH